MALNCDETSVLEEKIRGFSEGDEPIGMGKHLIFDLTKSELWKAYFKRLPVSQQDVYYTPEYYSLYEHYGDGKAECFVFEKGDDVALYPYLINSVNELGYDLDKEYFDIQGAYGYNGVVSSSYSAEFIGSFYESFNSFARSRNIIAEYTRFHPLLKNTEFSADHFQVIPDRKTVYLDLSAGYEEIFKKFQTTTRKQIKRCESRFGIETEIIEDGTADVEVFYSIYKEAMDRVNSIDYLYFTREYFDELIKNVKSVVLFAKLDGKPIASIIALYDDCYLHGHLGGALTEYLNTSSYSLLYSEMIKYGISKGCRFFNPGGGTTNSPEDKLLQFKLNFSHSMADFCIGKKVHNQTIYDSVVQQWTEKKTEKIEMFNKRLLKYRYWK